MPTVSWPTANPPFSATMQVSVRLAALPSPVMIGNRLPPLLMVAALVAPGAVAATLLVVVSVQFAAVAQSPPVAAVQA